MEVFIMKKQVILIMYSGVEILVEAKNVTFRDITEVGLEIKQ